MDQRDEGDRLILLRTPEERAPILKRLRRIEGQVRGLQQMVENDRYCGDELQQIAAVSAALREVAMLLAEQHVAAAIDQAAGEEDHAGRIAEAKSILRLALRGS